MAVFLVIALEIVKSAIGNLVDLASNLSLFHAQQKMLRIWPLEQVCGGLLLCTHYWYDCFFIPKILQLIFN